MANLTRRQWLKVGLAVGGMVTFGLSYRDVAKRAIDGLLDGSSGKITRDRIFGNALIPEANAQPRWHQNPLQVITMTQCGQPLSSVVARAPYRRLCPLCHGNGTVDRGVRS